MKVKKNKKGQIHPFSSSSDVLTVLQLVPATILTLTSILSLEDREVLAYMITRSLKTTTTTTSKNPKKNINLHFQQHAKSAAAVAMFECDCFECYTSYWFRWDSSPNRELIHHAIEAFEEHLEQQQQQERQLSNKRNKGSKNKNKNKKKEEEMGKCEADVLLRNECEVEVLERPADIELPGNGDVTVEVAPGGSSGSCHTGLVRKVLPDVLGIFNSRWWNLWGPNV